MRIIATIFLFFTLLFASSAYAGEAQRSRGDLEKEIRSIEEKAVKILADEFGDDLEVKILTDSYRTADEESGKTISWMAISVHTKLSLTPRLKDITPSQREALKLFEKLDKKHDEVEAEYERSK